MQVVKTKTPLSRTEAKQTLKSVWPEVLNEVPSDTELSIVTAQWAHETANGNSMYNYNFGGIKYTGSGNYFESLTTEVKDGVEKRITQKFRAYENKEAGARDFLGLLGGRYFEALVEAKRGNPEGFVRQLKAKGYFTGNLNDYIRSVSRLSEEILGQPIPKDLAGSAGSQLPGSEPSFLLGLPILKRGSEGEAVKLWQRIINVNDDGKFGPITEVGTFNFQSKKKLKIDGIVGPNTWGKAP